MKRELLFAKNAIIGLWELRYSFLLNALDAEAVRLKMILASVTDTHQNNSIYTNLYFIGGNHVL